MITLQVINRVKKTCPSRVDLLVFNSTERQGSNSSAIEDGCSIGICLESIPNVVEDSPVNFDAKSGAFSL